MLVLSLVWWFLAAGFLWLGASPLGRSPRWPVTYGRLGTWQPGAPLPRWRQQDAVDAGALPWDQVADHFARPASEGRALTGRLSVARKKKVLRHRACLLIGPAPWSSCPIQPPRRGCGGERLPGDVDELAVVGAVLGQVKESRGENGSRHAVRPGREQLCALTPRACARPLSEAGTPQDRPVKLTGLDDSVGCCLIVERFGEDTTHKAGYYVRTRGNYPVGTGGDQP